MKIFKISFLTLILMMTQGHSLELYLFTTPKNSQKIEITKLEGVKVNSECQKDKIHCLELLNKPVKNPVQSHKESVGNPASDFCHAAGGSSAILEDKKHNEYDFCLFDKKYFIDSWDFYRKFKK